MFKTSFFINISKRYLIYIYILRLFLYTSNLFALNKNIKFSIFRYSILLMYPTIAKSQRLLEFIVKFQCI